MAVAVFQILVQFLLRFSCIRLFAVTGAVAIAISYEIHAVLYGILYGFPS